MSLESLLLRHRPLRGPLRHQAVRALRHPAGDAGWDDEVFARHGLQRPVPRPGMALLLAATSEEGSVWTFAHDHASQCDDRLVDSADQVWRLAEQVALHTIPVVGDPAQLFPPHPRGLWLLSHRETPQLPGVLGRSFGLAFCLGAISRIAGVPLASDLGTSAEVDEAGKLHEVRYLHQKLSALRAWAPGVRRLIVECGQAPEAHEIVRSLQVEHDGPEPWLEVIGAETVQECIDYAFPVSLLEHRNAPSEDHEADIGLARSFIELLLADPPCPPRWCAVARGVAGLRAHPNSHIRWMASTVYAVASRHTGQPLDIPQRPEDMRINLRDLVAIEAQVVQTANDCCAPDWELVAASAERLLPAAGQEFPGHLQLIGALGRLYASQGRYRLAVARLERALDGWFLYRDPGPASRPLCELLRLAGVLGDRVLLERAEALVPPCLEVYAREADGRGFLQLARGRAAAIVGEKVRAVAALESLDTGWAVLPGHLQASRLRWLARLQPENPAWLEQLTELAEQEPGEALTFLLLAQADAGDERAMDRAEGSWAAQWARTGTVEPAADLARRLVLYPY